MALKIIPHRSDRATVEAIEAERRGAQLQSRLYELDKHVAAVYGYADLDDHFYVAMEYVEGKDLSSMINAGQFDAPQAARIAYEICCVLSVSHSFYGLVDGKEVEGIIHGDIKPQNVRVDLQDRIRLIDFGIAKALSQTRRLTRSEFGSTGYASPERLDTGYVDQHSDIWSVGVLLYEMVSGRQPFTEVTTRKLEKLILSRVPPPPLPDSCPDALRRIVMKVLAPDIKQRYASAAQMRDDLNSFMGKESELIEKRLDNDRPTRPLSMYETSSSAAALVLSALIGGVIGFASVAILLGLRALGFEDVSLGLWLILLLTNGWLAVLVHVNRAPERMRLSMGLAHGAVSGVTNMAAQMFCLALAALLGLTELNLRTGADVAKVLFYCLVFILISSFCGLVAVVILKKS
ncbi:MAG: eukaryotic-like serine/threonine-protein kinase [Acidobacteriota bacterium]|nr:eukaryotic-like serine/threonine-protein kinase [Acidobacteriota bacterium]